MKRRRIAIALFAGSSTAAAICSCGADLFLQDLADSAAASDASMEAPFADSSGPDTWDAWDAWDAFDVGPKCNLATVPQSAGKCAFPYSNFLFADGASICSTNDPPPAGSVPFACIRGSQCPDASCCYLRFPASPPLPNEFCGYADIKFAGSYCLDTCSGIGVVQICASSSECPLGQYCASMSATIPSMSLGLCEPY
jgi:hypothetical protein